MSRHAATSMIVRCERGKLVPATSYDAELLEGYKEGEEFVCRLTLPKGRSKLMSKYYAILERLIENTEASERWPTKEALTNHLLARLGYVKHFETNGNRVIMEPIRLSEMSATDFKGFYEAAMAIIAADIVPGIDMHALCEERVIAYTDDSL